MGLQLTLLPEMGQPEDFNPSRLVAYGIQSETATHRVHVDVFAKKAFVYERLMGISAMPEPIAVTRPTDWQINGYRLGSYLADGRATFRGIRIPWETIPGCERLPIDDALFPDWLLVGRQRRVDHQLIASLTTSAKGQLGVKLVQGLHESGVLRIMARLVEVNEKREQIKGIDIRQQPVDIQVKYDVTSASRGLFLQTHEFNPYGQH